LPTTIATMLVSRVMRLRGNGVWLIFEFKSRIYDALLRFLRDAGRCGKGAGNRRLGKPEPSGDILCRDSVVQPTFPAIDVIAAHSDG